jgi:hypothetical protein
VIRVVVLDSGPLGMVTHRGGNDDRGHAERGNTVG